MSYGMPRASSEVGTFGSRRRTCCPTSVSSHQSIANRAAAAADYGTIYGSSAALAVPREQSKREERAKRKKSLTAADSEEDKVGTKDAPGREISEVARSRRSTLLARRESEEARRASGKDRASEGAGPSSEPDEQSVLEGMLRLGVPREVAEAALAQPRRCTPPPDPPIR